MSDIEERLRALLAKATKRPWVAFDRGGTLALMKGPQPRLKANGYPVHPWPEIIPWTGFDGSDVPKHHRRANLHLIVEAVNALPGLLDELAPLKAENARLRAALEQIEEMGFVNEGHGCATIARAVLSSQSEEAAG